MRQLGPSNDLVRDLVRAFPQLRPAYQEHMADNGELLPYVLFYTFTTQIIDALVADDPRRLDWRGALEFLDERFVKPRV